MKDRASRVVCRAVMAAGLVMFGFTAVADSLPPNAYIPSGLLYHWDGVDNQATGTHDPNAATWVDRVGKVALTKSGTVTVEDDGMVFDGSSCLTRGNGTFPADSVFPWTTEVHFKVNNVSADFHVLGTNGSGGWTFLQEKGYFTFAPCHKGFTVFSGNGYVFAQSPQLKAGDQLTATGINQKPSVQIWRDGVFSAKYEDTVATSYNHNGVSTVPFTIGTSGGNGNRLKGKVFCARIYDRVLKPVEIAYNSAVDRVRFQGVSIADAQFPAGIRFNVREDRVEFCQSVAFDAAKGSVSANGEEIAPGPIAWYPYGTTVEGTVTLTATGKAGCLFGRWVGVPDGVDATSATITLPKNEAAGLTAEFILPAGAYVQRGLIYHWDGIDNQADGTYHPNATTWVDLVQGITLTQDTRETSSSPKTDAKFDPAGYGAIFAKKASCFAHTQPLPGAVFPFSTEVCFETHERSDRNQHVIGTNGSGGWTFLQSGTAKFSFVPYYNGDYRWADGQARPVNDMVTAYGSSEASLIALYTNGVFEAQTTVTGAHNNGSQNFRIGTSGSSANGLVGKIYASRIYDHVLTAGEVLFNANIDRMRFQNADAAELTWPEGVTCEDGQFWAEVRVRFDASKGSLAVGDIALESGSLTKVPLELGGVVTVTATPAEGYRLIGFTGDESAKVDFAAQTAKVSPLACNELTANFIAVTKVEDANGVTAKS
ncbi:MAG: hypothetical protein MJ249_17085, partial [Kiritimatiellae bacterium]|nr:hypothetical protein [Kiritimatiellia bacterium]